MRNQRFLNVINSRRVVSGGVGPSNVVAPVASVPYAIAGQIISVTNGTWSGTPTINYSYQLESSANGVSGWSNVGGATSNTYLIPNSAAQLLFYRWAVTASNGIGSPVVAYSNVIGGVDSQANTHFNRVTADSGVMTYGLVGVDTYIKSIKFIYNITDITTKFTYLRQLDYLGYKIGNGSGTTTLNRAVQTIYSACGVSGDLRQTSTTAQPALAAWSTGQNFLATFAGINNGMTSTARANPNNTKLTAIVQFRKLTQGNLQLITHGDNVGVNWTIFPNGTNNIAFQLADGSNFASTAAINPSTFNGYVRVIVTTSGSDLLINYATSTDGVNYSALGSQVTATGKAGQIGSTSRPFAIGARSGFHTGAAAEYLSAQVYDSTDTLIFNWNPNLYNRSVNQTQFTASTGETYTLNVNTGATGLKAMIVDQTMIQGNGTTMGMQAASLAMNTATFTQYTVWRKYQNVITAGSSGILNEFGSNVSSGQGIAFNPNDPANNESLYTNSNGGLNGTSWQSTSTALKLSTFEGDVNGTPYEQGLRTNNAANTFNAVQASGANTAAISATGDNLLARNNAASLWLNAVYTGSAMSIATDTNTEKSNMYNYLAALANII